MVKNPPWEIPSLDCDKEAPDLLDSTQEFCEHKKKERDGRKMFWNWQIDQQNQIGTWQIDPCISGTDKQTHVCQTDGERKSYVIKGIRKI